MIQWTGLVGNSAGNTHQVRTRTSLLKICSNSLAFHSFLQSYFLFGMSNAAQRSAVFHLLVWMAAFCMHTGNFFKFHCCYHVQLPKVTLNMYCLAFSLQHAACPQGSLQSEGVQTKTLQTPKSANQLKSLILMLFSIFRGILTWNVYLRDDKSKDDN